MRGSPVVVKTNVIATSAKGMAIIDLFNMRKGGMPETAMMILAVRRSNIRESQAPWRRAVMATMKVKVRISFTLGSRRCTRLFPSWY